MRGAIVTYIDEETEWVLREYAERRPRREAFIAALTAWLRDELAPPSR